MAVFTASGTGAVGRSKLRDFSVGATKLDNAIHDGEYFHIRGDHSPIATTGADSTTGASSWGPPTGVAADINRIIFDGALGHCPTDQYILGTQTILGPVRHASGINLSQDATNNDGAQYVFGGNYAGNPFRHVTGTTDDSFFRFEFLIEDADGTDDFAIGWRKQEAFTNNFDDATECVAINFISAAAKIETILANAATVTSSSVFTVLDGATIVAEVRLSKAGKPRYFINGVEKSAGVDYTAATATTFVPFVFFLQDTNVTEMYLVSASGGRMKSKDTLKAATNNG